MRSISFSSTRFVSSYVTESTFCLIAALDAFYFLRFWLLRDSLLFSEPRRPFRLASCTSCLAEAIAFT